MKCAPTLRLASAIIEGSNPQEEHIQYFPGDNLFTPHQRRRGLPLGNQTSQFFANVYLNPLDQFVSRKLRPAAYVRYVDDFLLFAGSKQSLSDSKARLEEFLCGLRLSIHPRKSRVYRCADGVKFLGWHLFPGHARLARANVVRTRRRMRQMQQQFHAGQIEWPEIQQRVHSWIGHAQHGNTWKLREQLFGQFAFVTSSRLSKTRGLNVLRAGSWNNNPRNLRVSNRNRNQPSNRNNNIGFRCARDAERSPPGLRGESPCG